MFSQAMLQAEDITSARCSRLVLSKLLAARKANFLSLLERTKNRSALMHANARKDNSSPLLTGNVRFTQRLSSKISVRISRYGIGNELIRTAQNNSYG